MALSFSAQINPKMYWPKKWVEAFVAFFCKVDPVKWIPLNENITIKYWVNLQLSDKKLQGKQEKRNIAGVSKSVLKGSYFGHCTHFLKPLNTKVIYQCCHRKAFATGRHYIMRSWHQFAFCYLFAFQYLLNHYYCLMWKVLVSQLSSF